MDAEPKAYAAWPLQFLDIKLLVPQFAVKLQNAQVPASAVVCWQRSSSLNYFNPRSLRLLLLRSNCVRDGRLVPLKTPKPI